MRLPDIFVQNACNLLREEVDDFFSSMNSEPATSIRLNKFKPAHLFAEEEKVAWCSSGRYLNKRPLFIGDPLFHAGAYYVQESSSMFVAHVLKYIKSAYNSSIKILDLCAAPGGKSTLMLDELTDEDLLVSNEIIKTRVSTLEENMIKWGRSNVVVTNNDPKQIAACGAYFDVMVIDAPCSGEGMFGKDKNAISEWSNEHTLFCAQRQKRILTDALQALKPGGYLIYSTCTFNQLENEENVKWMIDEFGYQSKHIPVDDNWGIQYNNTYHNTPLHTYRFYPHKVKGEGFFLSCLQKPHTNSGKQPVIKEVKTPRLTEAETLLLKPWMNDIPRFYFEFNKSDIYATPVCLVNDVAFLKSRLHVKIAGIKVGEVIKNTLLPTHQLALSIHINKAIPAIELDRLHALKYLKKDTFYIPDQTQGIYLITYQNFGLGWAKVLPNRINNYLPVNLRILKDMKELI